MKSLIAWKDSNDKTMYHFGVKDPFEKPCMWFSLFEDGVYDMFGKELCDKMREKMESGKIYDVSLFTIQIDL